MMAGCSKCESNVVQTTIHVDGRQVAYCPECWSALVDEWPVRFEQREPEAVALYERMVAKINGQRRGTA